MAAQYTPASEWSTRAGCRGALARNGGAFGVTGSPLDECEGGERFGDSRKEPDLARCREQRGQRLVWGAFPVFRWRQTRGRDRKQYVRESAHAQPPSERDRSVESVDRGGYLAAETRQARSITQGERFVDVDPVLGEEDRADAERFFGRRVVVFDERATRTRKGVHRPRLRRRIRRSGEEAFRMGHQLASV